ncbi:uncharacterized protein TRIREDRAFT_102680 [Trichoderma reesei QM6a]|uniref:Predicted protein n=2 Tax=Hypocrea jecorina TaxID=51453 RepID=G0R7X5_HYPJQ|nr:uncharacterized protein TRIREDRAFT_102680 [Trichoderma reesei QM6a]EGR52274.1 predicted protein [Trichoderma reesei QM6a]ETS06482.1 hypothetical protein M419DRAFT_67505 [Trichoderma reesei RUT C-30]
MSRAAQVERSPGVLPVWEALAALDGWRPPTTGQVRTRARNCSTFKLYPSLILGSYRYICYLITGKIGGASSSVPCNAMPCARSTAQKSQPLSDLPHQSASAISINFACNESVIGTFEVALLLGARIPLERS